MWHTETDRSVPLGRKVEMDPQERRRQILDCSAEIFARKGINATTIRDIAGAVGVHSGALYHYFPSKEAIVTELIREYIEYLTKRCREVVALPPDPPSNVSNPSPRSPWTPTCDSTVRHRSGGVRAATCANAWKSPAWRTPPTRWNAPGAAPSPTASPRRPAHRRRARGLPGTALRRPVAGDALVPRRTRGESMTALAHTIIAVFVDGMRNRQG